MPHRFIVASFIVLLGCTQANAEPLVFSATGCGPYTPAEEPLLAQHIALVGGDGTSEFLVHLGDVVSGSKKAWPETQYARVAELLRGCSVPVFVVPGDNEWNDLDDPATGWKHWTRHFLHFDKRFRYAPTVSRQDVRPENIAWVSKGVLLIGLNVVGGRVHDAGEWKTRLRHNADWARQCLAKHGQQVRAAVIFAQAMPAPPLRDFFAELARQVQRWGKPALYIHADGHVWQHEPGFMKAPNLLRVQTDQVGRNPPVLVTVTDDPKQPFLFDRRPEHGAAGAWPQFRGGAGAGGSARYPTEIGPSQNVVWKTPLPPGHSSPVVFGQRVYLTAVADKKLVTIGLDRAAGKELWRAEAPYRRLEKVHQVGNQAQATPATDGTHVVSYFGSAGLFCYDSAGKELWRVPMGPFKTEFGAAASPLIVAGRVLLGQDYDQDSFLAAFDLKTGKQLWRTDRSEFPVGCASPVLWDVAGKKQVVQLGTLRVVGYDFDTGKEIWTVRGLARVCNMTPAVGPDNTLYVAAWSPGADPKERIVVPPFADTIKELDKNSNGTIEIEELPAGDVKQRYPQFDRNRDGHLTQSEWEEMRAIFAAAKNRMVAIKPGGQGDITKTHVLWEQTKQLPYIPSPLVYNGLIFMVKNGGLVSTFDAQTGASLKYDRVPGTSAYFSSPVAGDGKVYLVSQRGELAVLSAESQWQVLHQANLDEDVFATPALAGGRIYLRTAGYLYCFGTR